IATRVSSSPAAPGHIPLVFAGFILFNLLMNAGPNSTTFTLAPSLFPTQLRATASGFAAGVAKIGATLGVFVLPILKGKFGVPADVLLEAGAGHQFGAIRLRTGRFEYRMVKAGKEVAKFNLTVEKAAGENFRFAGEAVGFSQKWESIATPMFHPVSATLRMQL